MHPTYESWYEKAWPGLTGNGIWLRGGEINTLGPDLYATLPYRVLIARLSTYRDVAVSTSHLLLYALCAGLDGIFPDIAYLPPPKDAAVMAKDNVPWLLGTQTKRGPYDFNCIGISLSIPQEIINLVSMLSRSGIALDRSERMDDSRAPLVLCGGASAGASAALFGAQSPVDGIFIGDDTAAISRLFSLCRDGLAAEMGKRDIVRSLEQIDGFVVPGSYRKTRRATAGPEKTSVPPAHLVPVSFDPERFGTTTVPITSGCRWHCSFCYESWMHKPYMSFPRADVLQRARDLKQWSGSHIVELFSFNYDMHENIAELVDDLARKFSAIGLKSQRFDHLAGNPELLSLMHSVGKASITCGMEGVSDRIREFLNKDLSSEKLRSALLRILSAPMRQIKIFLIATGMENESDFLEFEDLLMWFRSEQERAMSKARVIFSITPLVMFPSTPLSFARPPGRDSIGSTIRKMTSILKMTGFEARTAADEHEAEATQLLISGILYGDDNQEIDVHSILWLALSQTVAEKGFIYYEAISRDFAQRLIKKISAPAQQADPCSGDYRMLTSQMCVESDVLASVYAKCCRSQDPVLPDMQQLRATKDSRPFLAASSPKKDTGIAKIERVRIDVGVILSERCSGLYRGYISAALARALMVAAPELTDGYLGPAGSYWSPGNGPCRISGEDILTLEWRSDSARRVCELWGRDPVFVETAGRLFSSWGKIVCVDSSGPGQPHLRFLSVFPVRDSEYFNSRHLRFTRIRLPDNQGYCYELTKDAVRKKDIREYHVLQSPGPDKQIIDLVPGERFDPDLFCCMAFSLPSAEDSARVRVVASSLLGAPGSGRH